MANAYRLGLCSPCPTNRVACSSLSSCRVVTVPCQMRGRRIASFGKRSELTYFGQERIGSNDESRILPRRTVATNPGPFELQS